ncbi:MAG: four helix bundle protein [Bacteroidota bacterium]|nr:four helix bundle protein [Bacteroidota bacterium]
MSDIKQSNSIVGKKSYAFALGIISIYKTLVSDKKEFVLSKQLLRSGTSIGANVHEALSSESKRDFVHKLSIALKEAKETSYWLNLLADSNYISSEQFDKLNSDCIELIKILSSIILTIKEKYFSKTTLNS